MVCMVESDSERARNEIRALIEARLTTRKEALLGAENPPIPNVKRTRRELDTSPVYKRTKSLIQKRMDKVVAEKAAKTTSAKTPANIRFYTKAETDARDLTISNLTKQLVEIRKLLDEFQKKQKTSKKKPPRPRKSDLNRLETKYKIRTFLNYSDMVESMSEEEDSRSDFLTPGVYDVTSSYDQEERELDSMEVICTDAELCEKDIAADPLPDESDPFTDTDLSDVAMTLQEELHDAGGLDASEQEEDSDKFSMCSERISQVEATHMLSQSERVLASILGSLGDSFAENERLMEQEQDGGGVIYEEDEEEEHSPSETSSLEDLRFDNVELPLLNLSSGTNTATSLSISDVMIPTRDFTSDRPTVNFPYHKNSGRSSPSIVSVDSSKHDRVRGLDLNQYEQDLTEIDNLLHKYDEYRLQNDGNKDGKASSMNGQSVEKLANGSSNSNAFNKQRSLDEIDNLDHSYSDSFDTPSSESMSVKCSSGVPETTANSHLSAQIPSQKGEEDSGKEEDSGISTEISLVTRSKLSSYSGKIGGKPKGDPPPYSVAVQGAPYGKNNSTVAVALQKHTGIPSKIPQNSKIPEKVSSEEIPNKTRSLELRMKPDFTGMVNERRASSLPSYSASIRSSVSGSSGSRGSRGSTESGKRGSEVEGNGSKGTDMVTKTRNLKNSDGPKAASKLPRSPQITRSTRVQSGIPATIRKSETPERDLDKKNSANINRTSYLSTKKTTADLGSPIYSPQTRRKSQNIPAQSSPLSPRSSRIPKPAHDDLTPPRSSRIPKPAQNNLTPPKPTKPSPLKLNTPKAPMSPALARKIYSPASARKSYTPSSATSSPPDRHNTSQTTTGLARSPSKSSSGPMMSTADHGRSPAMSRRGLPVRSTSRDVVVMKPDRSMLSPPSQRKSRDIPLIDGKSGDSPRTVRAVKFKESADDPVSEIASPNLNRKTFGLNKSPENGCDRKSKLPVPKNGKLSKSPETSSGCKFGFRERWK